MERQFSQVTGIRYRRRIQFLNHYFKNPVNVLPLFHLKMDLKTELIISDGRTVPCRKKPSLLQY